MLKPSSESNKYIFTQPLCHRINKWRKAGLNLMCFFCKTGYLTKAKEPCLPYYFHIDGGRTNGFMLKGLSSK